MVKKKLIIFGCSEIAQLAKFYFKQTEEYNVVAFTIDGEFISENVFEELPVVPFQEVPSLYDSSKYDLFIALSYSKLNSLRKTKFLEAKTMGYSCPSYISPQATILNQFNFGENCFILEDNTIQPFVSIGDNVTLWSGNHIGHHSTIKSHSFITSHSVISGGVEIGEQCFVGVNSTLRNHIKIGDRCVLGAGSLILKDTDPDGVYIGKATERSRVPSSRLRGI